MVRLRDHSRSMQSKSITRKEGSGDHAYDELFWQPIRFKALNLFLSNALISVHVLIAVHAIFAVVRDVFL